jgi:peptidyl-tRNA hydrolase
MANIRLTVVVRKDLQMPAGLLAAQVAHMSDAFMRKEIIEGCMAVDPKKPKMGNVDFSAEEIEWCASPYLSVLGVECYEDLVELKAHAVREGLPINSWNDTIPSPTNPDNAIKAFVGFAIGPADFDAIKIVTNGLDLY